MDPKVALRHAMLWGFGLGTAAGCLAWLDWLWFAAVSDGMAALLVGFCGPFFAVSLLCHVLYTLYGGSDAGAAAAAPEEGGTPAPR